MRETFKKRRKRTNGKRKGKERTDERKNQKERKRDGHLKWQTEEGSDKSKTFLAQPFSTNKQTKRQKERREERGGRGTAKGAPNVSDHIPNIL